MTDVTASTTVTTTPVPAAKVGVRDFMPETRTLIMIGLFALTFDIFHMLYLHPTLQDNKLFFGLATLIVGTFFGGAVGFYFGSSQADVKRGVTSAALDTTVTKG